MSTTTETTENEELVGTPTMLTASDAEVIPPDTDDDKGFEIKDLSKLAVGESPFSRKEFKPRERAGWHQTIKRDDEWDECRGFGYKFVRHQLLKDPKTGKPVPRQAVGQEKGEVIKQWDHRDQGGQARYIAWMEIQQEYIDKDIRATVFRSHQALKDPEYQAQIWADGANSRIGKRDEVVKIEAATFEEGREEWHEKGKQEE